VVIVVGVTKEREVELREKVVKLNVEAVLQAGENVGCDVTGLVECEGGISAANTMNTMMELVVVIVMDMVNDADSLIKGELAEDCVSHPVYETVTLKMMPLKPRKLGESPHVGNGRQVRNWVRVGQCWKVVLVVVKS
jgi:hypothetical protein